MDKIFSAFFCFFLFLEYNVDIEFYNKTKVMNKIVKNLLRKFKKFKENHRSNVNILIECIAIIMIWRGVWDLLEIYVLPENQLVSNISCIIV